MLTASSENAASPTSAPPRLIPNSLVVAHAGVVVLLRSAGLRWLANYGDPYETSLFDPDGRVGIDWGVYGVPETFVIDRAGVVRYKHIGALTPEVIRERIEPLLRQLHG